MSETVSPINITEIAEILEDRKSHSQRIAVILGSRAGALFRSEEFYDELKVYSTRNLADMEQREQFYECYSILEDIFKRRYMSMKELKSFIEEQIRVHFYVENHLAELVKDDFFKVIITNNIDDVLYKSFEAVGMREKVDFVDFSLGGHHPCADSIELILSQRKINIRRLIRMGGDIDTFIGNLNKPQAKKAAAGECVRSLLEQLRIRELLIVGLDLAWDQAILSAIPSHLETIWFVNEDEQIKNIFLKKNGNIKNFLYIIGTKGNYDHFFKILYSNIHPSITESHRQIEEMKSSIYNIAIELNHMKKRIDEIDSYNRENIKLLHSKMDHLLKIVSDAFSSEISQQGPTLSENGNKQEANKALQNALPLSTDVSQKLVLSLKSVEIFFSYCHKDKRMLSELQKYLRNLKRQGKIREWHDGEISAGNVWAQEIEKHLSQADIILLLVSQDFLASEYCHSIEMQRALERHRKGEACVVPIILRPVEWGNTPFRELQALPKGYKAIIKWSPRDEGYLDVARGIQEVVDRLTGNVPLG